MVYGVDIICNSLFNQDIISCLLFYEDMGGFMSGNWIQLISSLTTLQTGEE